MLSITKRFEFCYGHHLPEYEGKCSSHHGHNSQLEVELISTDTTRKLNTYEGMILDFGDVKRLVNEAVIDKLDHKYLNEFIPIPTAENIMKWVVFELQKVFGHSLVRVRISETPDSWATWRR